MDRAKILQKWDYIQKYDIVTLGSRTFGKDKCLFLDCATSKLYDFFETDQAVACGNNVVDDANFFAFQKVGIKLGKIQVLLFACGDTGVDYNIQAVLHVQFLCFACYSVKLVAELACDHVCELQTFAFSCQQYVAIGNKFCKFLSAVLCHLDIAVKVEKCNFDSVRKGQNGQFCFVTFDIKWKGSHSFYLQVYFVRLCEHLFIVLHRGQNVNKKVIAKRQMLW